MSAFVFWVVMLCELKGRYQHFRGTLLPPSSKLVSEHLPLGTEETMINSE
jgi:hypothetical protein